MVNIIKLALVLFSEVLSEYKKSKKQNDIDQLEQDPHGWFSDRFGRLPGDNETDIASKTKPESNRE